MMKLKYFAIGFLCAGFISCSEDKIYDKEVVPAKPGDEIQFSANQTSNGYHDVDHPNTRTHYGIFDEKKPGQYAIYWNDGDEISIYSPQALGTNSDYDKGKEHNYKIVLNQSDSHTQQGTLSKVNPSDIGLQWGEDDLHHFFGFYPKNVKQNITGPTTVKMNLPTLQAPSKIRKQGDTTGDGKITLPSGTILPDTGTYYVAEPNMEYCYMYAHGIGRRMTNDPITLAFKPIPTAIEITILGPKNGEEPIEVSQVVLRSKNDFVGNFELTIGEYNDANDGATKTIVDGYLSNTLTIPTMFNEKDGSTSGSNLKPVTLKPGDALAVRAFVLPHFATEQSAVTVHMVGKGTRTKILNSNLVQQGKMNILEMPKLVAAQSNYWMTNLDPNVYFSQLSIPGSHNSYNFPENYTSGVIPNDNNTISPHYQTKNIQQQLEAGARAFSFQVGFDTNKFKDAISNNGWEQGQGVYPLYVYAGSQQTQLTLKSVLESYAANLKALNDKYEKDYPTAHELGKRAQEFIVLNITFTQRGGPRERQNEVQRWLKELDETMKLLFSDKTFTNEINDQTTIGDLVGEVIVLVNYQGAEWPNHEHGLFWNKYQYNYNPDQARNYVVMKETYDENRKPKDLSSLNDRDYDFLFYQPVQGEGLSNSGINLWRQNLERLNNTELSVGSWMGNRIQTKKTLITDLFERAVMNNSSGKNVGNWYLNNIGGFEVVNNDKSYNEDLGEGGNVVKEAEEINYYTYQYLANPQNNSAPCGVVLMNLFGESEVANTKVYSKELQQIIIDNNYRFPLKVKPSSSAQ